MIPERVAARLRANTPVKRGVVGDVYYASDPETGCWNWQLSTSGDGYGKIQWFDAGIHVQRRSHRVLYELFVGPVADDLDLDHLCRNRACCNPAHLEPVTRKENVARGVGHGSETHCPQGHAYDKANTYRTSAGGRRCRACTLRVNADSKRRRLERQRAS